MLNVEYIFLNNVYYIWGKKSHKHDENYVKNKSHEQQQEY